jgi:hypothetical protein
MITSCDKDVGRACLGDLFEKSQFPAEELAVELVRENGACSIAVSVME